MPVPVVSAPEPRGVPPFDPLRVRPGRYRMRRALGRWRRTAVAGLVVAAAALAAWAPHGAGGAEPRAGARAGVRAEPGSGAASGGPAAVRARGPGAAAGPDGAGAGAGAGAPDSAAVSGGTASGGAAVVSAPVRIADAATVRLLAPGDHVDVIAVGGSSKADGASAEDASAGSGLTGPGRGGTARAARVVAERARVADVPDAGDTSPGSGALVVLAVPRSTATALAAAGATSGLAVTLC
ncbi:hypothetical protein [Streptomyces sp. NPDC059398]|uniref:hypothetical protein n=1 Tax=Streptomyces sp. NPDC059398 TaxID=3346820 RepID=UPI0036D142F6